MKCLEMIEQLERLAPVSYACDWDNPGLLAGRREKEVKKVFIALDADDEAVDRAVLEGADLLITHHPLIFKPVSRINDGDFIGRRLLKLIQHDICYYAMHTNFDIAPGCMADQASMRLKLCPEGPLEPTLGDEIGIGKIGTLKDPVFLKELAEQVKEAFGLPFVTVYGSREVTGPVGRIAVSPGSGGSMITHALKAGVQVLVTGDISHHEGIDAAMQSMAVIDAGHYGLEHIFIEFMDQYLKSEFGEAVSRERMPVRFPALVW